MNRSNVVYPSGRVAMNSEFVGTTPSYEEARKTPVQAGSWFTDADEAAHDRVILLGQTIVLNLFGGQSPIGQTVKANGIGFVVAGTTTSLLTLPGVPFNAAHTYTLYLAGTPGQLTSIATRDD